MLGLPLNAAELLTQALVHGAKFLDSINIPA